MRALFDSNILIDYLNGIAPAKAELARYKRPAISMITWIEVLVGATAETESITRSFLSAFERVEVTAAIGEMAVLIRRESGLRIPDAIILATARVHEAVLWTQDADFAGLKGVRYFQKNQS